MLRKNTVLSLLALTAFAAPPAPARAAELDDLISPEEIAAEVMGEAAEAETEALMQAPQPAVRFKPEDLERAELVVKINKAAKGTTAQSLTVYRRGIELFTWDVSTGAEIPKKTKTGRISSRVTPAGYFRASRLVRLHRSITWQADMPWTIFFSSQNTPTSISHLGIATHAAAPAKEKLLGQRDSGGCIRLQNSNAQRLFDLVREVGVKEVPMILRNGRTALKADGTPRMVKAHDVLFIVENVQD